MLPYVIVSPDYDPVSGGIKVMWGLYGHLLARGFEVYMNQKPKEDFIAIYPEIVQGNPANGKKVVRYILNKPGVMTNQGIPGPTSFHKDDKLFYFSRLFGETDDDHYMFLPAINTEIFKSTATKRSRTAVFVGKGIDTHHHPKEAIYLTREFSRNQDALAFLLNECHTVYQYDPVSAMSEISRLCGCNVVYLASEYSQKDYEDKYEPGINGIGWGKEEKLDEVAFRKHYLQMKQDFEKQLDKFIEITQHD